MRNLKPINIDDFDITPINDLEVIVEFEEIDNRVSSCSFAEPISLASLSDPAPY